MKMETKYFKKADMPQCPVCKTRNVSKRGKRKLKDGRAKQRYACDRLECGKQFVENPEKSRRYDEFIRELSIFLFDKKLWTLRRTQKFIKEKFGVNPNITTIWRWYCKWLKCDAGK